MATKYANQERSTLDTIIEIVLFPLLFVIPYFVLDQILSGLNDTTPEAIVYLFVALAAFLMAALFYLYKMRIPDMPLPLFSSIYLAQVIVFVCFFIIFKSQESFRLPQQTLFQVSASFAMVVFFAQAALRGKIVWRRNYLNFPIFLILAFAVVSFAFSSSFLVSLKDFFVILFVAIVFWLAVNTWKAELHFTMLGVLAITIGGLMSIIGVAQHLNLNELYGLGRNPDPFSTLGNKNYVAELLAMLLPFALAMVTVTEGWWKKLLLWLSIESMLLVVIVAETRGSWFGLAAGLIVLVLYGLDNFDRRRTLQLFGSVGLLLVSSLIIMYMSQGQLLLYRGPTLYQDRFLSVMREINSMMSKSHKVGFGLAGGVAVMLAVSQVMLKRKAAKIGAAAMIAFMVLMSAVLIQYVRIQEKRNPKAKAALTELDLTKTASAPIVLDDSIASRRFIYGGTFEMIKQYPLGTGIGGYKTRYLAMLKKHLKVKGIKTIPGFFKDVNAKEAHNEYLHTWAEQGPVGLLLLVFFIIRLIIYFYKVYYKNSDEYTRMMVLGAFAGLVAIGTSAMLGFPFRIVPTAMICVLLMAIMVFGEDRAVFATHAATPDTPVVHPDFDPRRRAFFSIDPVGGALWVAFAFVIALVVSILSINWQRANILMKEGEYLAKARQFEQAKKSYEESQRLDPANGEIYFALGMLYQGLADVELQKRNEHLTTAIDYFKTSLRYYDLPMARLNLGAAFFQKGEMIFQQARATKDKKLFDEGDMFFKDAKKEFMETISIYPNYPLPWFNLGLMDYEYSLNAKTEGDYKKETELLSNTEKMLGKALFIDPTLMQANFKLAMVYEREGRINDAMTQYEKTIATAPGPGDYGTLADSYYNLGILYANRSIGLAGQANATSTTPTDAQKLALDANAYKVRSQNMFQKAIETNPQHIKAHNNLANLLYQSGDMDGAIFHYESALEIDPGYLEAKLNLALIYLQKGRFNDSLRYTNEMLASNPDGQKELKLLRIAGVNLLNLGRADEAERMLTQAVKKFAGTPEANSPDYITALINLAETKYKKGDAASAQAYLKQAAQNPLTPTNYIYATHRMAVWQANSGNTAGAEQMMAGTVNRYMNKYYDMPEFGQIVISYSEMLAKSGRAAQAIQILNRYLGMPISNTDVRSKCTYKLGWYYKSTGNLAAAQNNFQTVLRNWPSSEAANWVRNEQSGR